MIKPILQLYPMIPAKDEAEREELRPIGRNRERYNEVVNAQTCAVESANARHEWEHEVWKKVDWPEHKILMPGVIEHTTHVVEHPKTVADRTLRFADAVGRENVIAGTDCGFRGRSHPQVAWAKMEALVQGTEIAGKRRWC